MRSSAYVVCILTYVILFPVNNSLIGCRNTVGFKYADTGVEQNSWYLECMRNRLLNGFNSSHYIGLIVLVLLFFLLTSRAEANKIYIAFSITYGFCILTLYLLSFIVIY